MRKSKEDTKTEARLFFGGDDRESSMRSFASHGFGRIPSLAGHRNRWLQGNRCRSSPIHSMVSEGNHTVKSIC